MPIREECQQIQNDFESLKSLRDEFARELDEAVKTGEIEKIEKAEKLKTEIEAKLASLKEQVNPLERILHVREQYEKQRNILEQTGVLERLSSGEMGIRGIDGKEYPLPTFREVQKRLRAKRELLQTKAEQGFTRILIVPQGMSLDALAKKYGELIIDHFKNGELLDSEGNPITNLRKQGEGDGPKNDATSDAEYYPVWKWEAYTNADTDERLVYYPKEFSQNHGGKTKRDLLKEQKEGNVAGAGPDAAVGAGWNIIVIEEDPNIPAKGANLPPIGGRRRIEAGESPNAYLQKLKDDAYRGERGLTPEEWLIQAITYLEERNRVIDDWEGSGKINYNLGAYFPGSSRVPRAYWRRDYRRAGLSRSAPGVPDSSYGARSAVGV